jgi:NAD(P)-dependent dehydrogenase (short-subunit alcohol dehydrogenase family)
MREFKDKVAVVTGASKGLGLCIARALVEAGCKVAMLARPSAALNEAAAALAPHSRAFACDLRSPPEINAAFRAIKDTFGRIDILVNSAAAVLLNPIETARDADIMAELETNFLAPILCIREVVGMMKAQGGGDIVNISSESVHMPMPFLSIYAATKGGLETLSRGLRGELQSFGIRVMVLRSGFMRETSSAAGWDDSVKAAFFDQMAKSGIANYSGHGFDPTVSAGAIVDLLRLDRAACADFIELRSAN